MSDCGCSATATALGAKADHARRRVLWIVLVINLALFLGEFGVGWWADSSALQADSLDSLGDAAVYVMSLAVLGATLRRRTKAVFLKGGIQALFGIGVLIEVVRSAWFGSAPLAPYMAVAAAVAFVGNLACFALLTRFRSDDMNMRSVWLCSRNDLVNNVGVLIAAVLVEWLHSPWPDLLIGTLVAVLFLGTAWTVLRGGLADWHRPADASVVSTCSAAEPRRNADHGML